MPDARLALGLIGIASVLLSALALAWMIARLSRWRARRRMALVHDLVGRDLLPAVLTDPLGEVVFCNDAATARFGPVTGGTLAALLKGAVAQPVPLLFRLQSRATVTGAAREDVVTRSGHLRIAVHHLATGGFLWRIEDVAARPDDTRPNRGGIELAMLTVGRAGAILSMNDAARRLIGERIKSLDRLCTDLPLRQGHVHRISTQKGQTSCLVIENEPSGGRREIYLFPLPAGAGQEGGAGTDLNEGWRFFDALPVPLLKLDPTGAVLMSNRPARDLLAMRDGTPQRLSDLMEGLGRSIGDWLTQACAGRAGPHSEFLRLTRADSEVFVQVTLNKVHDRGQPALIAVLSDATELKTLEAQFVQSQKMQAIGELAGGVAHDFNNLLTAISGHCDLLLLRHDQGDPDYGDLVQIHQNANRAAALVGQLLAFSRKQTLRPEVLDLRDTLSDLTHLLNRLVGEKITLTLTHVPVQQAIRADKRQLEQVLMNLVVNARDAMPGGGEIRIETEGLLLSEALERDRVILPPGAYVSVKVSDHGHGIPADKLQKVFEPFYTTKRTGEGTGLGLSTAYGIVKQSGGYIFVDSVVGQGTCFTLLFPGHDLAPRAVELPSPPVPRSNATRYGDGVVLLVEDEAPVRAFASRALRLRGYTVIEADSAEQALRTLEDPGLSVDIFVTDVIMPGMDGPSWVREALKQRPGVRVVFVSGYAEESFGDAQASIPNSVFLPKPFSLNELTETVKEQLH
ncbi:MAG: response regulator [Rhodobacterales bacterium]|nr:response regulator [Rhodobacterales bacterium]MDX5413985.1 response regulator [Rhodobacterales bacterium]